MKKESNKQVTKRPGRGYWIGITFAILTIVGLSNRAFGFGSKPSQGGFALAESASESVVIPVEGMSCLACVARVKKTLKNTPGVIEAQTSLERREAEIRYDPARISGEILAKTIDEMGYKAGTPQVKGGM